MIKQKTFQNFFSLYKTMAVLSFYLFRGLDDDIVIKIMRWKFRLNRNRFKYEDYIYNLRQLMFPIKLPIIRNKANAVKTGSQPMRYEQFRQLYKTQELTTPKQIFTPRDEISFGNHLVNIMQTLRKELKIDRMQEIQARDRFVCIQLPVGVTQQTMDDEILTEWLTQVCNRTFSTAFNSLSKDLMTFNHTKIFCSESILRNIYQFNKKFKLTTKQMNVLNTHLQDNIVPFMQTKYPLTESHDVNKAINQSVKPIDNRQALKNDLLPKSNIVFRWDQSQNYNGLIMKFLNWLMAQIDLENDDLKSPYEQFYTYMSNLFENVYNETWMNAKTIAEVDSRQKHRQQQYKQEKQEKKQKVGKGLKVEKEHQHKQEKQQKVTREDKAKEKQKHIENEAKVSQQKYASLVKQYTHYSIGRKIPKDTQLYTEDQIANGYLSIKNSAILRILTKWCEELREKFTIKNYFLDRQENVRIQQVNAEGNTMFMWMKTPLNLMIEQQKKQIDSFMKNLIEHNFDQQSLLLIKQLQKDGFTHINKIEKACGKFAVKTVKNLHCYIVLYLNRLIHGLLTVSKKLYETKLSSKARWTSPPDLISFKVGDLMRCKCSSKQRQILKIFKELQSRSEKKNSQIKIIRVKNRLKSGTNDILINVNFKNKFICQIQLAVNSASTNNFIKCSNLFSHYIYELGRTLFGPVTELCSIWMSLDARAGQYNKIVEKEKRIRKLEPVCCSYDEKHRYITLDRPFICDDCKYAFSHSNFIWQHQRCELCNHKICARCRLENQDEFILKQSLLGQLQHKVRNRCLGVVNRKDENDRQIPEYGVCVAIKSKKIEAHCFRKITIKNIESIYGLKKVKKPLQIQIKQFHTQKNLQKPEQGICLQKQMVVLIKELISKDAVATIFKEYLIFEISKQQGEKLIQITEDRVKIEHVIPEKVKQIYIKQKEMLSMIEEQLDDNQIQIIKGDAKAMNRIRNMELADNNLQNVRFITSNFPNLSRLQLSRNIIDNIDTIGLLKHLKKLNLRNNSLSVLPEEICQLVQLSSLNIRHNSIQKLPERFGNLKELQKFQADDNKIQSLPDGFEKLVKLTFINLGENLLTIFPQKIRPFKSLQKLCLSKNKLKSVPDWISEFSKLKMLDLKKGSISNFPEGIFQLRHLQILKIESASKSLSSNLKLLSKLKQLTIQMQNITELPDQLFNLKKLSLFELEECSIDILPDYLSEMKQLINFSFINNKVTILPREVTQMESLRYLRIQGQLISELPQDMRRLTELKQLSLNKNKFRQIPVVIKNYKKLYKFTINHNQIIKIDHDFFSELNELQELQFTHNKLTELPDSIAGLKKLMKLNYEDNKDAAQPRWKADVDKIIKKNSQINFRTQKKKGCNQSEIKKLS